MSRNLRRTDSLQQRLFVYDLYTERPSLLELRSRVIPGHEKAGRLGHGARHPAAGLFDQLGGLTSRQGRKGPGNDDGEPAEGTPGLDLSRLLGIHAGLFELSHQLFDRGVREILNNGLGYDLADPTNTQDILGTRLRQRVQRPKSSGQNLGRRPANVSNAQPE